MIPSFPQFKILELADKDDINTFLSPFPPHSDYNVAGLWSYDTEDKVEISLLNDNLVLKSFDYVTAEPFLSFFGVNKTSETTTILLTFAKEKKIIQELRLISDFIIKETPLLKEQFSVEKDPDNFDYIYDCDQLITLSGRKYNPKRNFINRFKKNFPDHQVRNINILETEIKNQIIELFFTWEKDKNKSREETNTELIATKRFMEAAPYFTTTSIGIYVENKLIGFSLDEIVQQNYGVIHFEKADTNYIGIFQYLKQQSAINFKKLGCTFINYEQDLGIPEMRKSKRSWNPIFFYEKYRITMKTTQ